MMYQGVNVEGVEAYSYPMEKPILTKEQRREKREVRRQKQRENNVLRAAKMHKLRLASDLPPPIKSPTPTGTTYHNEVVPLNCTTCE